MQQDGDPAVAVIRVLQNQSLLNDTLYEGDDSVLHLPQYIDYIEQI